MSLSWRFNQTLCIQDSRSWPWFVDKHFLLFFILNLSSLFVNSNLRWFHDSYAFQNICTTFYLFYLFLMICIGRSISAYRLRDGVWDLIGIGSPQRPQVYIALIFMFIFLLFFRCFPWNVQIMFEFSLFYRHSIQLTKRTDF